MSLIFGILVFGALLAAVFGRRVGAMFVTGAGMLVMTGIGLVSIAFLWFLVANGFWSSHPSSSSSSYSSYGTSYGSTPTYGSGAVAQTPTYGSGATTQTYAPATQTPAPTYQTPMPTYSAAVPATNNQMPASTRVPRLGLDVAAIPLDTQSQLARPDVPLDTGATVTGGYGNPATSPSLQTGDIILKAGIQDQYTHLIDPSHPLSEFLARVPYNVPVILYVYRPGQDEFWVKLHPQ